ncbi:MAG TPA: Hint domain-containing protein [Aliiroseovarius sp.]|nr:Hint domain-containing protein [Aliiroseovarius sp.]
MPFFQPYLSEIRYRGGASTDFIEVALDNGDDPSVVQLVVYNADGSIRSTNNLPGSPDNTIAGSDIYSINTGVHRLGAVALVVDNVVVQFVSFDNAVTAQAGPANGLTSTQIGSTVAGESLQSTDMGASYQVVSPPTRGTIPCFLRGTLIDTPDGPRPIETLHPGDVVLTHDSGPRPLLWVGRRRVSGPEVRELSVTPILIPTGALGPNEPGRDIYVSPAHRILVRASAFEMLFTENEVLMAAKHLIGVNGIRPAPEITAPEYFHLLFEDHQILSTSGMHSESFHPMQQGLSGLAANTRRELFRLFPALGRHPAAYGPTSRRCLRAYEVPVAIASLARAA